MHAEIAVDWFIASDALFGDGIDRHVVDFEEHERLMHTQHDNQFRTISQIC